MIVDGMDFKPNHQGYYVTMGDWHIVWLHTYLWQKANGKLKKGYQVRHKDGDLSNNTLDNFICVKVRKPRKKLSHVCPACGVEFKSVAHNAKYCSRRCKSRVVSALRKANGLDNEERSCEWCGKLYVVNKYSLTGTCGTECGVLWRKQRLREWNGRNTYQIQRVFL